MPNEAETVEPQALDWDEIESLGWVLVHEGPWQNDYRAEKYMPNGKVEQSGTSKESLAEAISAWEALQESIQPQAPPEHEAIAADAEAEEALRTVTGPDGEAYTEAEWAARDTGYAPTAEAAAEGQEAKRDAADEAAAGEEVESEELITVNSSNQPDGNMSVLPGEESLNDVIERKAEASATAESDRGAANQGIGPHGPEGAEGYMGGEPETYDPGPGLSETELAMQQEREAQLAELTAAETGQAEAQLAAAQAAPAPAGNEAETEIIETNATPAAIERAAELGVDLSSLSGSGAGGKIVVSDVEDAAERE